jgi:predicted DNA-binding transcriptional regulator AlpA
MGTILKTINSSHSTDELLNPKEVHKLLKCSLPLVYKMADRGQLPCIRWDCPGEGRRKHNMMLRFKRADILEFIEKHYRST